MGDLPRMPRAILVMGYPPYDLTMTNGDTTSKLQAEGGDWYVTPSISANGHLIASAHRTPSASSDLRSRPPLTVGIYSLTDRKWTDYSDVKVFAGCVAISPNGSKLAFIAQKLAGAASHLSLLDIKSGQISGVSGSENASEIAWSPDGLHIAFGRQLPNRKTGLLQPLRALYSLTVETGAISKLTDGVSPSWSPSGEWIAFYGAPVGHYDPKIGLYDKDINSLIIMHPDGTGQRTLLTFHNAVSRVAPVWSPDSRTLLINKWHDEDKATMDIYLLDLATLKMSKKFGNTPPVFAWVAAK
jgi:Tol biopolymer transport system component